MGCLAPLSLARRGDFSELETCRRLQRHDGRGFVSEVFGGDVSAACELLDPQVVDAVPGTRAVSGGFKAFRLCGVPLNLFRLTEDPIDVPEWEDWMTGVDNVAGLAKIHMQHEGQGESVFRPLSVYPVRTTEIGD